MFCCLNDCQTIADVPADVLARFFELLADAQEDPERAGLWRLPPVYLAGLFRTDLARLFATGH